MTIDYYRDRQMSIDPYTRTQNRITEVMLSIRDFTKEVTSDDPENLVDHIEDDLCVPIETFFVRAERYVESLAKLSSYLSEELETINNLLDKAEASIEKVINK